MSEQLYQRSLSTFFELDRQTIVTETNHIFFQAIIILIVGDKFHDMIPCLLSSKFIQLRTSFYKFNLSSEQIYLQTYLAQIEVKHNFTVAIFIYVLYQNFSKNSTDFWHNLKIKYNVKLKVYRKYVKQLSSFV